MSCLQTTSRVCSNSPMSLNDIADIVLFFQYGMGMLEQDGRGPDSQGGRGQEMD